MQIWTLCDCDSKSPRSRAATNSNHQPQIVLQTTLNMAKSRCKPIAFDAFCILLWFGNCARFKLVLSEPCMVAPAWNRPTWLLPDCATCQPSRSPSLWPSRLVTSSLSRYPCLRDLKLFGLASWMLRVLPTLLMPSIFIKMLQHDSSLWVYEVSSSAFCVNLPKSCRKLWSAKSSSRRSKLHSASCLPLRERMKTKVSARVSMPFSFRALG